jgi:hypothetical protein
MKISAVPLTFAIALSLAATGCGGEKGGDISGIDPKVRFVNAFPDTGAVRAAVGGSVIGESIDYGTASDYRSLNNDTTSLTAGESSYDDLAISDSRVLANNHRYTGIGYGPAGSRRIVCLDNERSDASDNRVALRLFDALSTPSSVDVYFTRASDGDSLPSSPSVAGVTRGTASSYFGLDIGSGTPVNVRIRVYAAGSRTSALEDRTLSLETRYRGTVIALDSGADNRPLVVRDNS